MEFMGLLKLLGVGTASIVLEKIMIVIVVMHLMSLVESSIVMVMVLDGMRGCRAVQIAACIVQVFIEGVKLTYIDDLSVAFLILCKLEIEGVLIVRIWQ